ncbi:MAG: glutamate racemase [Candidatus Levybacteria bacterium]|nr:glutamate racemase [Candidatus Levybacteria bacterium]
MQNPIGIIDSGVGGLSIASSLIKKLPNESFIYVADSKNCPYGQNTREEIYKLTTKMINFLLKQKIKLLVIACNSITVSCINDLRRDYSNLPIVGIVPVIKTAVEKTKNKRIGIFSTLITANSSYQKDLIEKFAKDVFVLNKGSLSLVPLIENLNFEAVDGVLEKELESFKKGNVDTLALGCSHFPLIKDRIQKHLPGVLILDSTEAVSRQVERILAHENLLSKTNNSSYNFYTTGDLKTLEYFVSKLTIKAKTNRISI